MRLLHIVSTLNIGGLERLVSELAPEQQRRGHQAAVYCYSHKAGPFLRTLENARVPVFGPAEPAGSGQRRSGLTECVNAWQPDVVHSHLNFAVFSQVLACARATGGRPKLIATEHTSITGPRALVLRSLLNDRLARPWIARFTAVSREGARQAAWFYGLQPTHVRIIYNGVRPDEYRFEPHQRDRQRQALQLPPGAVLWGTVGRLAPVKGHDILLRAFALARQTDPRLYLVVVGPGAELEHLQALARALGCEPYVTWTGGTGAVQNWLSAFDYYVQPSRNEMLSVAVLEALANGLSVTATRAGGVEEIQGFSRDVDFVNTEDVHALAEAMTRRASQAPVARAESKLPDTFRFETMYQQYMAQYQALAA